MSRKYESFRKVPMMVISSLQNGVSHFESISRKGVIYSGNEPSLAIDGILATKGFGSKTSLQAPMVELGQPFWQLLGGRAISHAHKTPQGLSLHTWSFRAVAAARRAPTWNQYIAKEISKSAQSIKDFILNISLISNLIITLNYNFF